MNVWMARQILMDYVIQFPTSLKFAKLSEEQDYDYL